jgi:hypothetical protein
MSIRGKEAGKVSLKNDALRFIQVIGRSIEVPKKTGAEGDLKEIDLEQGF